MQKLTPLETDQLFLLMVQNDEMTQKSTYGKNTSRDLDFSAEVKYMTVIFLT